jgi:hypothetical protein
MYTPAVRRGTFLLVVILLLISILLEQAIAGVFPLMGQLGGVRPMIVFLDIPLAAPVSIDWVPVGFIFLIFYSIVNLPRAESKDKPAVRQRGWAILGRWYLLLILLLTGGGLYYGISGFLPKAVRNGLDSFGMRADLTLPYPSGETVHLQGSMIMLAFFIVGWRLLINKAIPPVQAEPVPGPVAAPIPQPAPASPVVNVAKPLIATPPPPIPAEIAAPPRGRIAMRIPEPVEVKDAGDRPCVYVSMPHGFERKRPSYPCVVEDGLKPVRKKELQQ